MWQRAEDQATFMSLASPIITLPLFRGLPITTNGAALSKSILDLDGLTSQFTGLLPRATFTPTGVGEFGGELSIASDDADEPTLAVSLTGAGQ
jgi:hypothetical protein